jgi:hypothetical protein
MFPILRGPLFGKRNVEVNKVKVIEEIVFHQKYSKMTNDKGKVVAGQGPCFDQDADPKWIIPTKILSE